MKSSCLYLLSPKDDKWYNDRSSKCEGLVTSVSKEDASKTQRLAEVLAAPEFFKSDVSKGDIVVVHHNVFRIMYDMHSKEKRSSMHYKDNLYLVPPSEVYAYSKDGGKTFHSMGEYTFVKPVDQNQKVFMTTSNLEKHWGEIEIPGNDSFKKGETVIFAKDSEYEFNINGQILYRVKNDRICARISR